MEQRRWTFRLPADGALGTYRIGATLDDPAEPASEEYFGPRVGGNFLVAAYRRPDFRVDATLGGDSAVAGTTLTGVAFSSSNVAGTKFHVQREKVNFPFELVMDQFERRAFAPQSRSQRPEKSLSGPVAPAAAATSEVRGPQRRHPRWGAKARSSASGGGAPRALNS